MGGNAGEAKHSHTVVMRISLRAPIHSPHSQRHCLYVTAVHIKTKRAINKNNYTSNCNSTFMNWGRNETDVTPDTAQHTVFKCNVYVYYYNITLIKSLFNGRIIILNGMQQLSSVIDEIRYSEVKEEQSRNKSLSRIVVEFPINMFTTAWI